MDINRLVEHCTEQRGCANCKGKRGCEEFKKLLENITEPWELRRLKEHEFAEVEE